MLDQADLGNGGVSNNADSVDAVNKHSVNIFDSTPLICDLPRRAATVPHQAKVLLTSQHNATNTTHQSVSTGISGPPSKKWEVWSSQANFYLWDSERSGR